MMKPSIFIARFWQFQVGGWHVLWTRKFTLRGGPQDWTWQCLN